MIKLFVIYEPTTSKKRTQKAQKGEKFFTTSKNPQLSMGLFQFLELKMSVLQD